MRTELVVRFDYGADRALGVPAGRRAAPVHCRPGQSAARQHVQDARRGSSHRRRISRSARAKRRASFSTGRRRFARRLRRSQGRNSRRRASRFIRSGPDGRRLSKSPERWGDAVLRSLLTLKALAHWETGGIVAAGTTSLPENLGGPRNWDYRFCWLRDATFTLYALIGAGFLDEAKAWHEWLLRAVAGSPGRSADRLWRGGRAAARRNMKFRGCPGYEGSAPVRIGNGAVGSAPARRLWRSARRLLRRAPSGPLHQRRDLGDGMRASSCISRQSGGSLTRASGKCEAAGAISPIRRSWRGSPSTARCARSRNSGSTDRSSAGGRSALRFMRKCASVVSIAKQNTLRAIVRRSERWTRACCSFPSSASCRLTIRASQAPSRRSNAGLLRDGFVMRYDTGTAVDGLPPGEGAFLACSFWLVDNYVLLGRYDEALRSLRAPVGFAQRRRACWRSNTILMSSVSLATFPRPSRISR